MKISSPLERSSFSLKDLSSLLTFSLEHPVWPFYPKALLERFLTHLTSSKDYIFDLKKGHERVALCVLLDKVVNPSSSINLEIIGKRADLPCDELWHYLLKQCPKGKTLQLRSDKTISLSEEIIGEYHLDFFYNTYEMKKDSCKMVAPLLAPSLSFKTLTFEHLDEYYEVLLASFKENEDTSIVAKEDIDLNNSNIHLLCEKERIVGFCSVIKEDSSIGEVHLVGVLPEYRGQGLGKILLQKAIFELLQMGATHFVLTVAAKNEKALTLYKKFGFVITEKDSYYTVRL